MDKIIAKFQHLKEKKHVKYGLPFIAFIVGASFGLREFTTLRYEFRRNESLAASELEKEGIKKRDPSEITLEKLYEKDQKEIDLDAWENIRGPRPWEDMTEFNKIKEENEAKKKAKQAALRS